MKKESRSAVAGILAIAAVLSACEGVPELQYGISASPPSGYDASARSYDTDVLIYAGHATATGDAEAIEDIVDSQGLSYDVVSSSELNSMTLDDLSRYGVIAWPGGYATQMSNSLTQETRNNIRTAVRERGVGYVGFCAGAFIAVSEDTSWGFSLMKSDLEYYYLENAGVPYAMTPVKVADGSERDLVWWGGPYLPEINGGVIARYVETNEPAIIQGWAGKGLMLISGPHPEAPESWRDKLGLSDSDGLDQELAWEMIAAALEGRNLSAF